MERQSGKKARWELASPTETRLGEERTEKLGTVGQAREIGEMQT